MGKIDVFQIILEKPGSIYYPGENVTGRAQIKVSERIQINTITLAITGETNVHWSERHSTGTGNNRRTTTKNYRSHEQYFAVSLVVLASQVGQDLYLESGEKFYPFQFVLPAAIPTSFEHSTGKTRYSIHGVVDIPGMFKFNKRAIRTFCVVCPFDLNYLPALIQPYAISDEKVLGCGPCKSEPIMANFSITKSGYVPGEGISFKTSLNNKSNKKIKPMTIRLIQKLVFFAQGRSHGSALTVATITFDKFVEARSIVDWIGVFVIPSVCPSSNGLCKIIQLSYQLVLNFDAEGLAVSRDVAIPLVIGTIPLQGNSSAQPSYVSSVFGPSLEQSTEAADENLVSDNNTFVPSYPVFKNF